MSSPKQKAESLVGTYRMVIMNEDTDCGNEILCTLIAIKNALVGVCEVQNLLNEFNPEDMKVKRQKLYYTDVKKEIEKL